MYHANTEEQGIDMFLITGIIVNEGPLLNK